MLRLIPLLFIPVLIYNIIAFGGGLVSSLSVQDMLSEQHGVHIALFSGDLWRFSFGDVLVLLTLLLLFVEVVKSTRTNARQLYNHGLSMLVFVIALVEFITLKNFGSTPFFFITAMCLFDVVAGYTISVVAAEHDLGIGRAPSN